jgi:serine/threonine-protein kinase
MFDSGEAAGQLYYVMPFVEGESLRGRMGREHQFPIPQAIGIAREIGEALGYAHARNIVHRDIKPDNVLLSSKHALVADFGVARAIAAASEGEDISQGVAIGTPAYMSPEQAAGEEHLDGRSDIYSLGCVLYEMICGQAPFTGSSPRAVMARHITEPVRRPASLRPSVPAGVEKIVLKALAKMPEQRFATADELAEALAKSLTPGLKIRSGDSSEDTSASLDLLSSPDGLSIAVLPFHNVGAKEDQEFFSDGITDELMNALARVSGLRVASRSSVFSLKGKQLTIREISEKLNVETVLEGSVRWLGDSLRISAELNDATRGTSLWSRTFSRKMRDVFLLQEEITSAIVSELKLKLGETSNTPSKITTRNPDAYQLYLRGRYCYNQRTPQAIKRALQFYSGALQNDADYALAYSGQADCYLALSNFQYAPPTDVLPKAEAAARKAVELKDSVADAHLSLAHILDVYHWDWNSAEQEYLRALELDPAHGRAHAWYADFLMAQLRVEEAFQWMARARELEPLSVPIDFQATTLLYRARRFTEAIAGYRRIIETEPQYYPAYVFIGFASANGIDPMEGAAEVKRAISFLGSVVGLEASLGSCLARAGHRNEAIALLNGLAARSTQEYVAPAFLIILNSMLGEKTAALDWLEKAYVEHSLMIPLLQVEPSLDPLRDDARFKAILRRVFPTVGA